MAITFDIADFLLDEISDICLVLNNDGAVSFANDQARTFLKLPKKCGEVFIQQLFKSEFSIIPDVFHNKPLIKRKEKFTTEKNEKIIEWKFSPLSKTANSDQLFVLIGKDITQIKFYEREYANIDRRLQSVVDSIAGNHWWKDLNGVYRGYNQALLDTLGLKSHSDVIGKTDYELPWSGQADALVANDKKVIESGKMIRTEEEVLSNTGKKMIFAITKVPLRDEHGKIIGTIGSSFDITEIKELEEKLAKASRSKLQLLNALNQSIRTQLSVILGSCQVLQRSQLEPKQMQDTYMQHEAAEAILSTLERFTHYLDLEQGIFRPKERQFDLKYLISDIVKDNLAIAKESATQINFHYDSNIPTQMIGAGYLLGEVLNILIFNATRFTQKGKIDVKVKLLKKSGNMVHLKISVQDTGFGIPKEMQTHIFDMFDLDINAPNHAFTQAGLNLSIVKKIIELLKGKISLTSTLQKGSCFEIEIPFTSVEKKQHFTIPQKGLSYQLYADTIDNKPDEYDSVDVHIPSTIDVLVVEDNRLNLRVTKRMLEESANCNITTATSVAEALTKLDKSYDLVLLDINLPDGKGIEIIKKIRELHGDESTPILAVTAHYTEDEKVVLNEAGVTDVITKPFTLEMLDYVLKDYVFIDKKKK